MIIEILVYIISLIACLIGSVLLYRNGDGVFEYFAPFLCIAAFVPLINFTILSGFIILSLVYSFLEGTNKLIDKFYRE